MKGRFFSPGFVSALVGIALTISAYLEIWFWPAWPAFAVLELMGRRFTWVDLPFGVRAAVVVGLIAINIAFWAVAVRLAWWLATIQRERTARRRQGVQDAR